MRRCKSHADCPGGAAPIDKKGGFLLHRDHHCEDAHGPDDVGMVGHRHHHHCHRHYLLPPPPHPYPHHRHES